MSRYLPIALLTISLFAVPAVTAQAQFIPDDVVVGEFFDNIQLVQPGSITRIFEIVPNDNHTNLTIADPLTGYVTNFTELWKIDLLSNETTVLAAIGGTSASEITMDLNGDVLYVNGSDGVGRVDSDTGAISQVFDDSFFGPDDITVSAEGNIYVTEFFDGLGVIKPDGTWTKLGDWDTNFFSHLDLGPDGYLYLVTTFEGGDVYKVNPSTGSGIKIGEDIISGTDDIQVASDGTIYIAGLRDTDDDGLNNDVVLTLDQTNGSVTVIVDDTMVGNPSPPFFNPMDLEIFNDAFYEFAPATFVPATMDINQGTPKSGTLADLAESDNADLVIARKTTDIQSRTRVQLTATSHTETPSVFEFTLEASVFARTTVNQSIYLFNYQSFDWELMDTQAAKRFSDKTVTVAATGDMSRFVQPGTGAIQARIQFISPSQRQQFTSAIDQAFWTIKDGSGS